MPADQTTTDKANAIIDKLRCICDAAQAPNADLPAISGLIKDLAAVVGDTLMLVLESNNA